MSGNFTQKAHWLKLRKELKEAGLDPVRIEAKGALGVPDVNFVGGWIELKQLKRWPLRDNTPVRIDLSTGQRAWIKRRTNAGGQVFVALRIGEQQMLFYGEWTVEAEETGKPRRYWEAHDLLTAGVRPISVSDALKMHCDL